MKRIVTALMENLSEIVLVSGSITISVGVGMIYFPAGLITGGCLAVAGAVLSVWGEENGKK